MVRTTAVHHAASRSHPVWVPVDMWSRAGAGRRSEESQSAERALSRYACLPRSLLLRGQQGAPPSSPQPPDTQLISADFHTWFLSTSQDVASAGHAVHWHGRDCSLVDACGQRHAQEMMHRHANRGCNAVRSKSACFVLHYEFFSYSPLSISRSAKHGLLCQAVVTCNNGLNHLQSATNTSWLFMYGLQAPQTARDKQRKERTTNRRC